MKKWHILGKLILNSCSCCFTCWQGFWLQSSIKNDKDSFPGDPVVLVQAHFLCLLVEFISCSCRTEVSIFISGCQPRVALISVKKTDKQKLQLNRIRGPGEKLPHLWQQQSWTGRRKIPLFSWQGLGQWKIMDSLLTLPSQVLFPLNKSILLHLLCGDLHVSSGCRKLNCSSLLILNKPVFFFGWRNNWKSIWLRSMFWWPVWGSEKTLNNSGEQIGACIHKLNLCAHWFVDWPWSLKVPQGHVLFASEPSADFIQSLTRS